uniref:Uncharacterized protein n=1 Tax=Amphora coffeiformis TaxID=265554 RepID=A0A7S3L552_9STRA|eukprot:scaffold1969_cov191-Amphora_coffeaeformis.AAC.2
MAVPDDSSEREQQHKALYDKARSLWLSPSTEKDLDEVETILRTIWASRSSIEQHDDEVEGPHPPPPTKRSKKEFDSCSVMGQTGSRLALWLIQSNRVSEADEILQQLSFQCRLSSRVLRSEVNEKQSTSSTVKKGMPRDIPCRVYDRFLSDADLNHLLSVFGDIESSYWMDHNYSVEPPSPYFSYLIPLKALDNFGFLGSLITRLKTCLMEWQPLLRSCSQVEMWAHNRPAATGHQLHFDTDNEGYDSTVRHPLMTCILYLTEVGGPSLVTNQRKSSRYPADKGWLSHSAVGRMTALDGRVLHCVLPGQATTNQTRRITLMLAFWRRIKVRGDDKESTAGAARKFPTDNRDWARRLREPTLASTPPTDWSPTQDKADPEPLDHVFENLSGEPWPISSGLPSYDCVFQGI